MSPRCWSAGCATASNTGRSSDLFSQIRRLLQPAIGFVAERILRNGLRLYFADFEPDGITADEYRACHP